MVYDTNYNISSEVKIASVLKSKVKGERGEIPVPESTLPNVENKLQRQIGLLNCVAITIATIIGSGIFIAPKGIIKHVGSVGLSLTMWVFSGLLPILGAFCYAELATMFPSSGGVYIYILEAFGPLAAFLTLWVSTILHTPGGNAILALTTAKYALQLVFGQGCEIPNVAVQLLAAVVIGLTTFINCCNIRETKKILNTIMFFKLAALTCIIAGGTYAISIGQTHNVQNLWVGSKYDPGTLVLASFSGFYAYSGWESIVCLIEELKEPNKNLPRGVLISLLTVIFFYVLANASYFVVLSVDEILESEAIAVTFVEKIWGSFGWIVPIMVAFSTLGSLTVGILQTSRSCFVGARCGQLPNFLSLITISSQLPIPAVIFLSLVSLLYLYSDDLFILIELRYYVRAFETLIVVASIFYFRWFKPDLKRPFKVTLIVPIMYFIITMAMCVVTVYDQPVRSAFGAIVVLSGVPIYYTFLKQNRVQWEWIQYLSASFTKTIQKLLLAGKED